MSSNPFTAQASFNVMNPQASANSLLNAVVTERVNDKKNFQSGLNNAIMQVATNVRNQRAQEAAMARQLQQQEARTELEKFQSQLIESRNINTEDRALKRELESGKYMFEAFKSGLEMTKELQDPDALPKTLELYAGRKIAAGVPFTEQEVKIFAEGTDKTIEEAEAYLTRAPSNSSPQSTTPPAPMVAEVIPGSTNEAGAYIAGVQFTEPYHSPNTLYDSLVGKVDQDRRKVEADIDAKVAEGIIKKDKALKLKEKLDTLARIEGKKVSYLSELTDDLGGLASWMADVDDSLVHDKGTTQYNNEAGKFKAASQATKELYVASKNLMKFSTNPKLGFDPRAEDKVNAVLESVLSPDSNYTMAVTNARKLGNVFVGGTDKENKEATTAFFNWVKTINAKGASLARIAGETGNLSNPDVQRATLEFFGFGADSRTFNASLTDTLRNLQTRNIIFANIYDNPDALKFWANAAKNDGYVADFSTETFNLVANPIASMSVDELRSLSAEDLNQLSDSQLELVRRGLAGE
jgi:hypothetical protein